MRHLKGHLTRCFQVYAGTNYSSSCYFVDAYLWQTQIEFP